MIGDDIQYSIALLDSSEESVKISDINRQFADEHSFSCPFCKKKMYATFGPIRIPHFRHNGEKCDYENYLHAVAEYVFLNEFKACLEQKRPFLLEYYSRVKCRQKCIVDKNICAVLKQKETFDLAQKYTRISREKNVPVEGGYRRPDILLESGPGEQLWVEMWVTHRAAEEKLKQGSVLEIKISREEELKQFEEHKLSESETVHYYPQDIVPKECEIPVILDNKPISEPQPEQREEAPIIPAKKENHSLKYDEYEKALKKYQSEPEKEPIFDGKNGWIDLGLPSGTLWSNSYSGEMSFHAALERFAGLVPTSSQFDELRTYCKVEWEDGFYARYTGPNGNTIELRRGKYWLNSYNTNLKPTNRADCIDLFFGGHGLINDKDTSEELSVRLVRQ